ncbi:MAG: hypothetical protein ACKV19_24155 [Verrucomicrobiales bacterium]
MPLCSPAAPAAPAATWQTYPDDQDPMSPFYNPGPNYSWVAFDYLYGHGPAHQYKGVWGVPNSWPRDGDSVDINIGHIVHLNNIGIVLGAGLDPVLPFPSGQLALNGVNIQEGAAISSSLDLLSFDGGSTWSRGYITGKLHNMGDVVIAAPSTVGGGGEFLNSNRISIPTTLSLAFGLNSLRNQSSGLPNAPYAEIALTQPNATINANSGGGGSPIINNYGVIRKTGVGTAYIQDVALNNYAAGVFTRSGTIQVDSGTLVNQTGTGVTNYYGLKAEIAPGAVLLLSGPNHLMNPGITTVTGGGIMRLPPGCVIEDPASTGAAQLAAPEGKLECAGAEMRNLVNAGSIHVTADSVWRGMVNLGHVRQINVNIILGGVTNGSAANSSAVWDLENTASFAAQTVPPTVYNYAHLRKSGPGTSEFNATSLVNYGSATDANAGRIEVTGGVLRFPGELHFNNGGSIRVASGTTMEMAHRIYFDTDGTLTLTGSGKVRLQPGAGLYAGNATVTGTLNAAPGTWELNGGSVFGPANNLGEITVTAPTDWNYGLFGNNTITNSGTLHCLATSAGSTNSITLTALMGLVCTPSSVLSFDIAGRPGQNTQWARMLIGTQNYPLAAGGKLRINFGNFTPVSGDRWRVIDYQSVQSPPSGDFTPEFTNVPAGFVPFYEKVTSGGSIGYEVGLTAAPAPQTYAQWATAQNFATGPDAEFSADPDKDGWSNGLECALGTNPNSAAAAPASDVIRYNNGGDLFLGVQYTRPGGPNRPIDVQYIGERSDELGTWTTSGVILESGPLDAQGNETITLRLADPFDYHPRGYLRLRVQQ